MSDAEPIVFADAEEARAWDLYYAATVEVLDGQLYAKNRFADAMLRERRKRMRCDGEAETWKNYGADPNDGGEMVAVRCAFAIGHEGECQP